MPKFGNLPLDTKLSTIIHELSTSTPVNGDIRRSRPKYAHGYSLKKYAERVDKMRAKYLTRSNGTRSYEFLQYTLEELEELHGPVVASRIKQPRPILLK